MKKLAKKMLIILSVATMTLSMTACADMIIAPIAANTAKNVMGEANRSSHESDAATLNNACKTFYAGVVSGTINSSNGYSEIRSKLPSSTANNSSRKEIAKSLTVQDAMIEHGLTSKDISGMYYSESDGTIEYFGSHGPTGYQSINSMTTLGELYSYGASSDTYESSSYYNNEFSYPSYDY